MVAESKSGHRSGKGSEVISIEVEKFLVFEGEGEIIVESFHEEGFERGRYLEDARDGVEMVQDLEALRVNKRVEP